MDTKEQPPTPPLPPTVPYEQPYVPSEPIASSSPPISSQPPAAPPMIPLPTTAYKLPNEEFSTSLFGCTPKSCLMAWCCSCVVYGENMQRLEALQRTNEPMQEGDLDPASPPTLLFCALNCCFGCGYLLDVVFRKDLRIRYGIRGNIVQDFFTSFCCLPCSLTQETRELELEELAKLPADDPRAKKVKSELMEKARKERESQVGA